MHTEHAATATTTDWITAWGTVATGAFTLLLAIFAAMAFRASLRQLRLLAADSARQARPYVNVDISPGLHGIGFWDITIENVGRSMARDVRVNPGPLMPKDAEDHISTPLAAFLSSPLMLPPGARRRLMWRMEADPKTGMTAAGADETVDVRVTYTDGADSSFDENFRVTTENYGPIAPAPTTGSEVPGGGRDKGQESLANIERVLRALNIHVGSLRR